MDKITSEKTRIELTKDWSRDMQRLGMLEYRRDKYIIDKVGLSETFGAKIYKEGMLGLAGKVKQLTRTITETEKLMEGM